VPTVWLILLIDLLGVDYVGRQIFAVDAPIFGVLVLLAIAVGTATVAAGTIVILTSGSRSDYSQFRRELLARAGERLPAAEVSELRARLAELDRSLLEIRLGFGNRSKALVVRDELAALVSALGTGSPSRAQLVSKIRSTAALRFVLTSSVLRLMPVLVALCLVVATALAVATNPGSSVAPLAIASLVAPIFSAALAYLSARVALAAKVSTNAVHRAQRDDVVRLIGEFDRTARKGVAGLGDRVTRALQILREQQQ
jgi:hypothetical protein